MRLVEFSCLAVAASLIIITTIPSPVLGSGPSLGVNASRSYRKERLEEYRDGGDDEEYEEYNDYGDSYADKGDYKDEDLNGQDQRTLLRNAGRRGSFGISSQFWGQIFHIHQHYHKVVGVNWDQDEDKKDKCIPVGSRCDSRHDCCKKAVCKDLSCIQCVGDDASCATIKNCCNKNQKCINNKCTDWCIKRWENGCSESKPCCDPVYPCSNGVCKARQDACASLFVVPCNSEYPCCSQFAKCKKHMDGSGDKCLTCAHGNYKCNTNEDCCYGSGTCQGRKCRK